MEIINKIRNHNLNKYNVDWFFQSDEFKNKSKEVQIERYGDLYCNSDKFKNILLENKQNKYNKSDIINYYNVIFEVKCIKCNNIFEINRDCFVYRYNRDYVICNICNEYLDELDIKYEFSCRNKISKELDIYIPDYNIAIEFNGIYWHSSKFKDINYHFDKTNECSKIGIDLIHIWEHEWVMNKDKIKSLICYKLGLSKIIETNDIRIVSNDDAKIFLDENYLDEITGDLIIGMYYENELYSIMVFNENILVGFFEKIFTTISNGFDKMFKYYLSIVNYDEILSVSDNSYSFDDIFNQLGFKEVDNI